MRGAIGGEREDSWNFLVDNVNSGVGTVCGNEENHVCVVRGCLTILEGPSAWELENFEMWSC